MGKTILSKELIKAGIPVFSAGAENRIWGYIDDASLVFPQGTIVISARGNIGFPKLPQLPKFVSTQTTIAAFPTHSVLPDYLCAILSGVSWDEFTSTTAIPMLTIRAAKNIPVQLAPFAEQRRIVSRIDELFSRIEAGERAIAAARVDLKRYRKAILKAAVTGALTEDWRATHKPRETGEALLARILKERRATWEAAELAKLKAKGKPAPKTEADKAKLLARYTHPYVLIADDLPENPKGWAWASVDQLMSHITSGSRDWKPFYDRGTSVFVLAGNIRPRKLDLSEVQRVDPPPGDRDAARSLIAQDDLLITIVGANTGDLCRVQTNLERHYVCQSVALMRPVDSSLSTFLEVYLSSEGAGRTQMDKYIYGAGRPHLSFEQLRGLAIPLPPAEEQTEIVSRVEEALSRADAAEATLDAQTRAARALKQSILKAAFTGRLVPQDPNDEPASELLKRVKESG